MSVLRIISFGKRLPSAETLTSLPSRFIPCTFRKRQQAHTKMQVGEEVTKVKDRGKWTGFGVEWLSVPVKAFVPSTRQRARAS